PAFKAITEPRSGGFRRPAPSPSPQRSVQDDPFDRSAADLSLGTPVRPVPRCPCEEALNGGEIRSPDPELLEREPRFAAYQGTRSLVTGGLGFIGSNLVRALHSLGSHVIVVDSLLPGGGANLFNLAKVDHQVDIRIADLRDGAAIGA